jgi:hypothetical protein
MMGYTWYNFDIRIAEMHTRHVLSCRLLKAHAFCTFPKFRCLFCCYLSALCPILHALLDQHLDVTTVDWVDWHHWCF